MKKAVVLFFFISFFVIESYGQNAHEMWDSLKRDKKRVILEFNMGINCCKVSGDIGFIYDRPQGLGWVNESVELMAVKNLGSIFYLMSGFSYHHFAAISTYYGFPTMPIKYDYRIRTIGFDLRLKLEGEVMKNLSIGMFGGGEGCFFNDVDQFIYRNKELYSEYDYDFNGTTLFVQLGVGIKYKLGRKHFLGIESSYAKQMDEFEHTYQGVVLNYFQVKYCTFLASYKYKF